ncbi:DUF676 domain-containing protein [Trichoderma simmonsii]|uniref:DUF676 domain-containing protein n=1 Tax=Trichoderma simmonsii TaxID=1491479 RepID=A0A8G0PGB6_9HYPO|nr:DUF676 domain-containing protein [Trichoderma simmonsii]
MSTYRVRGVPADWDCQRLQAFLSDQGNVTDAVIESLAHENNGVCQVATATFENLPSQLQHGHSWSILIPRTPNTKLTRKQYLTIDNHFHGLTTLYTPSSEDHKIDIIALLGLGGHAFGSFKEKGGSYMWLRDSLPYDLTSETKPIARVMIYGYDSTVAESKSMQNFEDFATKLNGSLQTLMNTTTIRPIILIGHSLGGLIIKQALILLSGSEHKESQTLIRAVYGVVFFGTPHHGMDISSLIPMAGDGPNRSLIESLSHYNSQILTMQHREFHKVLGDEGESEVFCFYETLKSPTAQQDQYGRWTMTGPDVFLVTKSSATHCRPWEVGAENICALTRTHSELVKFKPNDSDYDIVKEKIEGICKRAFVARGVTFDLYCKKCQYQYLPSSREHFY